ncbi:MAG: PRC-barrel domain-containing protein [Beijerinckiaceae bacterium]
MLRTSTRNFLLATCIAAAPSFALAQSPAQQKVQPNQPQQQSQAQQQNAQPGASQMSGKFLAAPQSGHIRAADLRDADIYTADNQKVGDIDDLLLDQRGNIIAIVVGVGGFLGIGEKNVAIPFESLEIQNPNMATASNMNGARTTGPAVNNPAVNNTDRMTTGAVPNSATSQERERTTAQRAEDMANRQADRQSDRLSAQQQANQQRQTTTTTANQRTAQATVGLWKPDRILLKGLTKADLENAPEFKWDESARNRGGNVNAPSGNR